MHKQGGFVLAINSRDSVFFRTHHFAIALAVAVSLLLASTLGCNRTDNPLPSAAISGSTSEERVATVQAPERLSVNLQPIVKVHTSMGDFTLQLDAKAAPLTVENFLAYVNSGHYNGTIFHQAYHDFILLGGGFDAQFNQRAAEPPVRNEAHNGAKNMRGTIALARQPGNIDSGAAQFFINLADNPSLDFADYEPEKYGYCVFGQVTEGMDVIDRIAKGDVHNTQQFENVPIEPVVIESMRCVK
jgi:cyclophilin family peptidyl-prolyl cis-trans isomerase